MELTATQQKVLDSLPATDDELAEKLGVTTSTVRDHIKSLVDAGVPIIKDADGKRRVAGEEASEHRHPTTYTAPPPKTSGEKAAETRRLKELFEEMKHEVNEILAETEPAIADGGLAYEPSNEDVVLHCTDDHIGAQRRDEFGNIIFNSDIAVKRIEARFDRARSLWQREETANRSYDTLNVLLGGDTVHGEGIFSHQPWESDLPLDKQIQLAVKTYYRQICEVADEFDTVQIVAQSGNHGEIRGKNFSASLNADDLTYGWLESLIREGGPSNVTFISNESTNFTNFTMRGGNVKGHLRHGQDSLQHIGTSSGKNKWRGWLIQHGFDVGYRGHFHEWKLEHVMNRPVLMSGSICPPGDFEESLSVWSEPSATLHGVSDEHSITFIYPVHFDEQGGIYGDQ